MKITDILTNSASTLFTFELMPPLKGDSFTEISDTIDALIQFNPAYINITHHRAEVVLRERPDGLLERIVTKKRPGTVSVAAAIKYKYGIEVVSHLVCGGYSKNETEDALIDLNFLGINNVLALRGDAIPGEKYFTAEKDGHKHAAELVRQIKDMNAGKYLDPELKNPAPTEFCIGVAAYPEKHTEAPNLTTDLEYLKAKVDAGASYIVTQMFFDNAKYFDFVKQCRDTGIDVPIIPGLKPFSTAKQLNILPQIFHIDLPDALVREVQKCTTTEQVRQVGVEWGIAQCRELKAAGVPALHFYTMGKADNVAKIVKEVF